MEITSPYIPIVLLAEPEEAIRESIEMILIDEGYECHSISTAQSLKQALRIYDADLIIADVNIVYDHIEEIIILQNSSSYSKIPHFLITLGYEQVRDMLYLMQFGITEYFIKPFQFDDLTKRLRQILDDHPTIDPS